MRFFSSSSSSLPLISISAPPVLPRPSSREIKKDDTTKKDEPTTRKSTDSKLEDSKKEKKERTSKRADKHPSHRSHRDKKSKDGGSGIGSNNPSNPFEASKDTFANPFNFGSSANDPFADSEEPDPFDFDLPEANPFSFAGAKVNLSALEPKESFVVDTKNPFGAGSSDDFGRFSFSGAAAKGDDPFA